MKRIFYSFIALSTLICFDFSKAMELPKKIVVEGTIIINDDARICYADYNKLFPFDELKTHEGTPQFKLSEQFPIITSIAINLPTSIDNKNFICTLQDRKVLPLNFLAEQLDSLNNMTTIEEDNYIFKLKLFKTNNISPLMEKFLASPTLLHPSHFETLYNANVITLMHLQNPEATATLYKAWNIYNLNENSYLNLRHGSASLITVLTHAYNPQLTENIIDLIPLCQESHCYLLKNLQKMRKQIEKK